MTFVECRGCELSAYDGMNLKCAAMGEKIYIHLVEKCLKIEFPTTKNLHDAEPTETRIEEETVVSHQTKKEEL